MSNPTSSRAFDPDPPEHRILVGSKGSDEVEITPDADVSAALMAEYLDASGQVGKAPILTLASGDATYFEANSTGVFIDALAMVTDADDVDFDGATLIVGIIANGSAGDRLGILHQGTGAGQVEVVGSSLRVDGTEIATFEGGTGVDDNLVITFGSGANDVDVEAVARRIAFRIVTDESSTLQRTISMQVSDANGETCTAATRAVTVVPEK